MSDSRIYEFVMFLQSVATMVRSEYGPARSHADRADPRRERHRGLQTAIVGGAEAICTTDEDFFTSPASAFLRSVNILVFTDPELLRWLRS